MPSAGEPASDPEPDDGVEGKFKATLVARAKKREVVELEEYRGQGWRVLGNSKLGDSFPHYDVVFDHETRKYVCDCYLTQHGESRARKVCSHVLAVILYRKEHRGDVQGWGSSGGDTSLASVDAAVEEPASTSLEPSPLDPSDPYLTPRGWDPPPSWLAEYRPHQWQAAHEIVDHYERGAKVVFLDAPTGSGKTAIADLVSRLLKQRAIYVCSGKDLQEQFLADFPYAKVLKGRANYPTLDTSRADVTADDCNGHPGEDNCTWCQPMTECPYRVAKMEAAFGQVGVLNTAYWLREANSMRPMFSRPRSPENTLGGFMVVDECDTLESSMMGYLEYAIYSGRERQLKVKAPKKGSHKPTIVSWMKKELADALREAIAEARKSGRGGVETARAIKRLQEFGRETLRVAEEVEDDNWIRDNDAGPLVLKPVSVAPYGEKRVWRHGGRWLLMSATIISAEEMAESLGIEDEWAVVRVPMTFPVDQRPVHVVPVAEMKGGEKAGRESGAWDRMAVAIGKIIERHPDDRVLIHTVSYALAEYLAEHIEPESHRRTFTYNRETRAQTLREFRTTKAGVLFAPSMDRGVDLKDDDCRVVVVAKVPFPYLGDKQVSARLHSPGGQAWYTVSTIRTLVQMTGRGVRHEDDWCESYVLDSVMLKQLWKKDKRLFPGWWAEAVDLKFPMRLLR